MESLAKHTISSRQIKDMLMQVHSQKYSTKNCFVKLNIFIQSLVTADQRL